MIRAGLITLAVIAVATGCTGAYGQRCEDPERYAGSVEVPPVRVPGDLSVPDESDALQIPRVGQPDETESATRPGPCLESPPDYFETGPDEDGAEDETATEGTGAAD
jgi:uncharacterized lipoprotein